MKLRKWHLSSIAAVFMIFAACASQKQTAVRHEFPEAMIAPVKAQYLVHWEKGKVIYGITCAKCHNMKVGRKEIIPDFTEAQLAGYNLRQGNSRHEDALSESVVSAEDLALIYVFLTYKNKTGIPVKHSEDDGNSTH